jgi:hypothetical protein
MLLMNKKYNVITLKTIIMLFINKNDINYKQELYKQELYKLATQRAAKIAMSDYEQEAVRISAGPAHTPAAFPTVGFLWIMHLWVVHRSPS